MTRPEEFIEDPHAARTDEDYYADLLANDFWMRHQNHLDEQDRMWEKGDGRMARRARADETRVRTLAHPRTGNVEVQPRQVPLDEAA